MFFEAAVGILCLFALNVLLLRRFPDFAIKYGFLVDIPNWRSSHTKPTIRGSGVLFVWSALLSWIVLQLYFVTDFLPSLIGGALLIAAVSFLDDLKRVSAWKRLLCHAVGSAIFLSGVPQPVLFTELMGGLTLLWWPLAIVFMVGIINLYNFMDGIDGLCASHSLVLLMSWLLLGTTPFGEVESMMCLCLAAPLTAFLMQNWSPARTFMGDVGSTFLGFTFAALAIHHMPGISRSTNFYAIMLLMMPFLFDASFTLVVRFAKGDKWYLPHRSHIFQRLVSCGFSHAMVSLVYALMTVYAALVLFAVREGYIEHTALGVVFFLLPYFTLYVWLSVSEARSRVGEYSPLRVSVVRYRGEVSRMYSRHSEGEKELVFIAPSPRSSR